MTRAFIIAGVSSGSGKTTLTTGIISLLVNKGYTVQTYKAGPDYIDPLYHQIASGKPCYNLDTWIMGQEGVEQTFYRYLPNADFAIIEGVMGLFDGKSQAKDMPEGIYAGSTAHLACVLGLPVILIINATATAQSVGAVVYGFRNYVRELNLTGIIFNNVAGKRHFDLLLEGTANTGIPVVGFLPKDASLHLPDRHLGLISPMEQVHFNKLRQQLIKNLDLSLNIQLLMSGSKVLTSPVKNFNRKYRHSTALRIGIAMDKAFWFYYQENFDILKDAGLNIIFFSPLRDQKIPQGLNALYFGGGYPELFVKNLSQNRSMLQSISDFGKSGGCIYAECGGFMLLTKGMYNLDGDYFKMTGLFNSRTKMSNTRVRLGYREVELSQDMPLGRKGEKLKGHEFHYSYLEAAPNNAQDIYNNEARGFRKDHVFASYVHIHFGCKKDTGECFVRFLKYTK